MKKLLAFLATFAILVVGATILAASKDKTTEPVEQSWTLTGQTIEEISLTGLSQPVKLVVRESDAEATTVQVKGLVSKSVQEHLEKVVAESDRINLALASDGIGVTLNDDSKAVLEVTVTLAKGVDFNNLYVSNTFGAVEVSLPQSYDGQYKFKGKGKVLDQPAAGSNQNKLVEINTAYSDITVIKE